MITEAEIFEYEITGSWWAWLFFFTPTKDLIVKYFAWKSRRKWKRYQDFQSFKKSNNEEV